MRSRFAAAVAAAVLAGIGPDAPAATQPHPSERANRAIIGIDRIDQRGNDVDRLYWYERTGAAPIEDPPADPCGGGMIC